MADQLIAPMPDAVKPRGELVPLANALALESKSAAAPTVAAGISTLTVNVVGTIELPNQD